MNIVVLGGNLSKDPKLSKTASGISVLNCTIAVNRDYKDKDGNYQLSRKNSKPLKSSRRKVYPQTNYGSSKTENLLKNISKQ